MVELTAIGLGELLWDVLPEGKKLGGAPANFAYQFGSLGGNGIPVSRVGDDALGREALAILEGRGIPIEHISIDPIHPTGTVDAVIDTNGVATYSFPDDVAWDFLAFGEKTLNMAASVDVICFGSLAQRSSVSQAAIHSMLSSAPHALKIFDINLRQHFYTPECILASLGLADILKINDEELQLVTEWFELPKNEEDALKALLEKHGLKLAVLTRGGEGSLILSPSDRSELSGRPVKVVDTIGAGDAFTAALALAALRGLSLDEINEYASNVAGFVCGQAGAMPSMPNSLKLS